LLNLPLLCAALFFILRLIYLISDQANEAIKSAGSSLSISTIVTIVIGYTMMIIILAQSMLIAASALNVNNISKITKKTREIIQGGVGAGLK